MTENLSCNGCSYEQLLRISSKGIVQKILYDMSKNRFSVGKAMEMEHKDRKKVVPPKAYILYRWWFPEETEDPLKPSVWQKLKEYSQDGSDYNADLQELLKNVEQCTIDGKKYRALYFGKSHKGSSRYRQHTKGDVGSSTVRHNVYGVYINAKYNAANEPIISEILSQCYCEWVDLSNEEQWVECFEELCIALGYYPLNIEGNPVIGQWCQKLLECRKISKKERNSSKK